MPAMAPVTMQEIFPARQEYLRLLVASVLCWAGVVLLESFVVFANDASRGYVLFPLHYVAWAAFNWYVLAALTPLIFELGRRYPVIGPGWPRRLVTPHALACLACVASQAIGRGLAGSFYTLFFERHAAVAALTLEWIDGRLLFAIAAYWIIVVIAAIAQLREQVRQRELRQAQLETRLASAELEKLRIQIQPHFLFNTLQAAITLVPEDPQAAEDVLLRLSRLLRISLDEMENQEIPLARELEFLDLYTGIQHARFGDRLKVEIHADDNTLELNVPPLILQPLVENAIHHGIGKHKGEDVVEVYARRVDNGLQIEVWNSNSVVEETGERLMMRGLGLRNTRARLEHIYGPGASLIFRPLARGGAAALIYIPLSPAPAAEQEVPQKAAQ